MKKRTIIMGSIALAMSFSVGAATGTKITAELQNRSVICNSNTTKQQIINYKGISYIPLKSFASLLQIPTKDEKGVIYIGESNNRNISYWGKDIKHMAADEYMTFNYQYNGEKTKNNVGDVYTNYLELFAGNIEFPLRGKYTTFEATLAVPEGFEQFDSGEINIFVDEKNVYSKIYSPSDMPQSIKINISDAQKIRFNVEGGGRSIAAAGLFDGKFIK